jgi:cell division protein FtsB
VPLRRGRRPGAEFGGHGVRRPTGPARRTRAPLRPHLSGRAAALILVLLALVAAYAFPVRQYLAQRAEISRLQSDQAAQRQRIADLNEKYARWSDPDYVNTQARTRLQFVPPGATLYYIVKPEPDPTAGAAAGDQQSFLRQMWSSVQAADHPTAP